MHMHAMAASLDGGAVSAAAECHLMRGTFFDAVRECPAGKPERWVHSQSKRPHSHDVRTLCVARLPDQDPILISGGNDAQLLVHSVPRYTQV